MGRRSSSSTALPVRSSDHRVPHTAASVTTVSVSHCVGHICWEGGWTEGEVCVCVCVQMCLPMCADIFLCLNLCLFSASLCSLYIHVAKSYVMSQGVTFLLRNVKTRLLWCSTDEALVFQPSLQAHLRLSDHCSASTEPQPPSCCVLLFFSQRPHLARDLWAH